MTINPDRPAGNRTGPPDGADRQVVFLVGAERSGTTLLRFMLNNHPLLAWRNEFEYAVDPVSQDGRWPPLDVYLRWLSTHRVFQASRLRIDPSLDYPGLVRSFLTQTREQSGKPLVGATVHRGFDKLRLIWPEARFIHVVRDGRDVARSAIGMGWCGNVWTGTDRWIEAEHVWETMRGTIPEDRRLDVTYEQSVLEPVETLRRICDFIGIPYHETMLQYHRFCSLRPPDPRLVEQWRTKLSPDEVQLVESRIAQMLVDRGYELSGLERIGIGALRRSILVLQDRWARTRSRIGRFGLALVLCDFFSRRLGLDAWQARVRFRLNAITSAEIDLKPCCYDVILRLSPGGLRPPEAGPGSGRA